MAPPNTASTPLLGQFLVAINGFIAARNETQLASYLALEPPFGDHYNRMIAELRASYPSGREEALEQKCSSSLAIAREGAGSPDSPPWQHFIKFMLQYLCYLRDVDPDPKSYLLTYDLLAELQQRANSALNHPTLGTLMLPEVVANAKLLCRLAIGLDKQPQLLAQAQAKARSSGGASGGAGGGEDGGQRETLPERAANILRNAFVTCLNDRASGLNDQGKPEGKKRGIYTIANLCLRILFQCRKTRNATQIFENIYNLSPPLTAYPKRERVTYLYYLGRFLFQNGHFYRAQLVLQHAYDESPVRQDCVSQRRQLLVYLLASNIILGRMPTEALLSRPEAQGFNDIFAPICIAIKQGDLAAFHNYTTLSSSSSAPYATWLLRKRILLPLHNRAEVLVWRSLARRIFLLYGTRPDPNTKLAPTLDIHHLVAAFSFLETRASQTHSSNTTTFIADPDFDGVQDDDHHQENTTIPAAAAAIHTDTLAIESVLSSLIDQGLLGGYVSRSRAKFAITGSKAKGSVMAAGFPSAWGVMRSRAEREDSGGGGGIPGWKKVSTERAGLAGTGTRSGVFGGGGGGGGAFGPGMVVNLSGLRPVGAAG